MTKYKPLSDRLASHQADEWTPTFAEVEEVLGFSLPKTARAKTWWANESAKPHARAWTGSGWEVATVDPVTGNVTFRRSGPAGQVRAKLAGAAMAGAGLAKTEAARLKTEAGKAVAKTRAGAGKAVTTARAGVAKAGVAPFIAAGAAMVAAGAAMAVRLLLKRSRAKAQATAPKAAAVRAKAAPKASAIPKKPAVVKKTAVARKTAPKARTTTRKSPAK